MKLRKKMSLLSVGLLVTMGGAATASPANAATACPTNYLCLYTGVIAGTGTRVVAYNGTNMYNHSNSYYFAQPNGETVRSSINNTLGRMCTYDPLRNKTNILAAQTRGTLASTNVATVKIC